MKINNLKFFSNQEIKNEHLLIKITDFIKMDNNDKNKFDEIFIDPCVYDLVNSEEYKWINKIEIESLINSLKSNEYISLDYPSDMNIRYSDMFKKKSYCNALKYHDNKHYIVTVQSNFMDYDDFVKWFNIYNDINIKSGIMGIGNFCRILYPNEFIIKALDYCFKNSNANRIHIYGLGIRLFKYAYTLSIENNIELSIDSMKWTRPLNTEIKNTIKDLGYRGHKKREMYFNEYIKKIKNIVNESENDLYVRRLNERIFDMIN